MTKRQKFATVVLVLGGGFFTIQITNILARYEAIAVVVIFSLFLSFWALRENLKFNATLLTLIIPVFFTAGIGFFYFLLPASLLARLPIVVLYALGMYAVLLSSNIYGVSALRTIALLRTAHAVGFLLTLATSFFLFDTVLSLRSYPWVNGVVSGLIIFPLILQNLWSFDLGEFIKREILQISAVLALGVGEAAFLISLWPVTITVGSLFLTTLLYVMLGLSQADIQGRLFARTVREYLFVGAVVFAAVFLTSRWGG